MKQNFEFIEGSHGGSIKAWIKGVPVEDDARKQLSNIAAMPFVYSHLAVMPDVHVGIGATVGSVIPTIGAIIPAAVGVDLGCGMVAVRTSLRAEDLPDNLSRLRALIERNIPHGRTDNGGANDRGAWGKIPKVVEQTFAPIKAGIDLINDKHPKIKNDANRIASQLGTLGTGNHFVEICLDENQNVWVMLHSGSRGIGGQIGQYFINQAKEEMARYFIKLIDKDLSYLVEGSSLFNDYIEAVSWAQNYARLNREVMMKQALAALTEFIPKPFLCDCEAVNCHHNYVSKEFHFGKSVYVTRKGAVSAKEGELGIIPGAMGRRSFIVRGKGNHESFCSCSHGAGRIMSRTKAKEMFTVEDHIKATQGLECRKDVDVIDETPMAYKNVDDVMAAQSDLVDIVHTLSAVLCVKG